MQHRLLLQVSLGLACLAGTVLGQTVKFVNPPKEVPARGCFAHTLS